MESLIFVLALLIVPVFTVRPSTVESIQIQHRGNFLVQAGLTNHTTKIRERNEDKKNTSTSKYDGDAEEGNIWLVKSKGEDPTRGSADANSSDNGAKNLETPKPSTKKEVKKKVNHSDATKLDSAKPEDTDGETVLADTKNKDKGNGSGKSTAKSPPAARSTHDSDDTNKSVAESNDGDAEKSTKPSKPVAPATSKKPNTESTADPPPTPPSKPPAPKSNNNDAKTLALKPIPPPPSKHPAANSKDEDVRTSAREPPAAEPPPPPEPPPPSKLPATESKVDDVKQSEANPAKDEELAADQPGSPDPKKSKQKQSSAKKKALSDAEMEKLECNSRDKAKDLPECEGDMVPLGALTTPVNGTCSGWMQYQGKVKGCADRCFYLEERGTVCKPAMFSALGKVKACACPPAPEGDAGRRCSVILSSALGALLLIF